MENNLPVELVNLVLDEGESGSSNPRTAPVREVVAGPDGALYEDILGYGLNPDPIATQSLSNAVTTIIDQYQLQITRYETGNPDQRASAVRKLGTISTSAIVRMNDILRHYHNFGKQSDPCKALDVLVGFARPYLAHGRLDPRFDETTETVRAILTARNLPHPQMDKEVTYSTEYTSQPFPAATGMPPAKRDGYAEANWDMTRYMAKDINAADSFVLSTSDVQHTHVVSFNVSTNSPEHVINKDRWIQASFESATITVRYNPMMFMSGRYVMTAVPYISAESFLDAPFAGFRAVANPYSVEIDISSGDSAVLVLPWVHPNDMMRGTEYIWEVEVVCLAPLQSATGVATTLNMYHSVAFNNYKMFFPKTQMGIPHVVTRPGMQVSVPNVYERAPTSEIVPCGPGVSINNLTHRDVPFNIYAWETSDVRGAVLAKVPVHPWLGYDLTNKDVPPVTWEMYKSMWYSWWTGSMRFRVDPVTMSKHSGSLLLVWVPDPDITPTTVSEFMNYRYALLHLNNQDPDTSITVEAEWNYDRPWRPILPNDNSYATTNGNIFVVVYNPLLAPDGAPTHVSVLLRQMPGPDSDYKIPTIHHLSRAVAPTVPRAQMVPQVVVQNDTSSNLNPEAPAFWMPGPDFDYKIPTIHHPSHAHAQMDPQVVVQNDASRNLNPEAPAFQPRQQQPIQHEWDRIERIANQNALAAQYPVSDGVSHSVANQDHGVPDGPNAQTRSSLSASGSTIRNNAADHAKWQPNVATRFSNVGTIVKDVLDVVGMTAALATCAAPEIDSLPRLNLMTKLQGQTAQQGWTEHIDLDFSDIAALSWGARFCELPRCCAGFNGNFTFTFMAELSAPQQFIVTHIPPDAYFGTPLENVQSYGATTFVAGIVNGVLPFPINSERLNRFFSRKGVNSTSSLGKLQLWMPSIPSGTNYSISVFFSVEDFTMYAPAFPPPVNTVFNSVTEPSDFRLSGMMNPSVLNTTPRLPHPQMFHWPPSARTASQPQFGPLLTHAASAVVDSVASIVRDPCGITTATGAVAGAATDFSNLLKTLQDMASQFSTSVANMSVDKLVSQGIHAYLLVTADTVPQFIATAIVTLQSFGITIKRVLKIIGTAVATSDIPIAQAGDSSILERVLATFTLATACGAGTVKYVTSFVRFLSDKGRSINNLQRGISSSFILLDYLRSAYQYVSDFYTGHVAARTLQHVFDDPDMMLEFFRFVEETESTNGRAAIQNDPLGHVVLDTWSAFVETYVHHALTTAREKGNDGAKVKVMVEKYITRFLTLYNDLHPLRFAPSARRVRPFMVCVSGDTAAGKSVYVDQLCDKLTDIFGYNPHSNVYTRNPTVVHWNGYVNQPIVRYDDVFAYTSAQGDPALQEILLAGSTASYEVPMAALGDKGKQFTSHLVIMNTNVPYPKWNDWAKPANIWSRRNILIHAYPWNTPGGKRFIILDPNEAVVPPAQPPPDAMTADEMTYVIAVKMREHILKQLATLPKSPGLEAVAKMYTDYTTTNAEVEPVVRRREYTLDPINSASRTLDGIRFRIVGNEPNLIFEPIDVQLTPLQHQCLLAINAGVLPHVPRAVKAARCKDADTGVWSKFCSQIGKALPSMSTNIKWMGIAVGCLWAVRTVSKAAAAKQPAVVPQSGINWRTTHRPTVPYMAPSTQGGTADNNEQAIAKRILPHVISAHVGTSGIYGFPLKGKLVGFPGHLYNRIRDEVQVVVNGIAINAQKSDFTHFPARDFCVYRLPATFNSYPNNIPLFHTESSIAGRKSIDAALLVHEGLGYRMAPTPVHCKGALLYSDGNVDYRLSTHLEYDATNVGDGDCGTLIIEPDNINGSPLLGFHVAGWGAPDPSRLAYGSIITREFLEQVVSRIDSGVTGPTLPVISNYDCLNNVPPTALLRHGRVHPSESASCPRSTTLRQSSIFDQAYEHETEPAMLTSNDPRYPGVDPAAVSVPKFGKTTLNFPEADVLAATQALAYELNTFMKKPDHRRLRLWTEEEAINGSGEDEYCHGIDMSTSPGLPYAKMRSNVKGKTHLFTMNNGSFHVSDRVLRERLDMREIGFGSRERIESVWFDVYKDEKRPVEKVAQGKTRLITIPPVDYVITFRKYCGDFVAAFYASHRQTFSAVGMNPESYDWTRMYEYLASVGTIAFDADYSNFDGSISPQILDAIRTIIDDAYDGQGAEAREVLFDEIAHTTHQFRTDLFTTLNGHPSGNPATTVINTMANYIILYCSWLGIARETRGYDASLDNFRRFVRTKMYGDDNIVSVAEHIAPIFNRCNIANYLAKFGFVLTSANKSTDMTPYDHLSALTFLRRGFRACEIGNHLHAPIEPVVIQELTNWIRKAKEPTDMLRDNCRDALHFAVQHGEEFFNATKKRINAALSFRHIEPLEVSFYAHHDYLYGNGEPNPFPDQLNNFGLF